MILTADERAASFNKKEATVMPNSIGAKFLVSTVAAHKEKQTLEPIFVEKNKSAQYEWWMHSQQMIQKVLFAVRVGWHTVIRR